MKKEKAENAVAVFCGAPDIAWARKIAAFVCARKIAAFIEPARKIAAPIEESIARN